MGVADGMTRAMRCAKHAAYSCTVCRGNMGPVDFYTERCRANEVRREQAGEWDSLIDDACRLIYPDYKRSRHDDDKRPLFRMEVQLDEYARAFLKAAEARGLVMVKQDTMSEEDGRCLTENK